MFSRCRIDGLFRKGDKLIDGLFRNGYKLIDGLFKGRKSINLLIDGLSSSKKSISPGFTYILTFLGRY